MPTNPTLLEKLRPEPAVNANLPVPTPLPVAEKKQGWLGRLAGTAKAAGGKVVNLARRTKARVAQVAPGWLASGWGRLKVLAQGCWAFLVGVAGTSWQARQPLLLALGVGSVIGLGCYLAGPLVASTVSGLAAFVGSLVASARNAVRRALAGMTLQEA